MEDILTKRDFVELSALVQAKIKGLSWWQRHGMESVAFLARLALFTFGYFIFSRGGWLFGSIGMVILSYSYTGIAITGTHETSHLSYAKGKWVNKWWALFFSDFWSAQSHLWWHYRHVQVHHLYPNVMEREPKPFYFPWLNRYAYFFLVPYLVLFWLMIHSIAHLRKQPVQLALYLVVMGSGLAFHAWLFTRLGFSIGIAITLTFVMRSLFAPIFMHLAVFNHIGLDNPHTVLPWIPRQGNTTRNIKPTWFLTGMGGNAFLQCHLEHHLFPSLSNHVLAKVRPTIRDFFMNKGYVYKEETYVSCLANCVRYYHEVFQNLPKAIW